MPLDLDLLPNWLVSLRRRSGPLATLGVAGYGVVGLALWYDLPPPINALGLLMAFLIAVVSPVSAIGAALAATPLIFDPVELSGREFSLLELAILFGGAGIGVNVLGSVVFHRSLRPLQRVLTPWPLTLAIGGLLVAACVSLSTLADERYRPESVREFRLVIVEPLLFFAACRWVLVDAKARRFASFVLVATGAAVGAFAIGQIVIGSDGVIADGVRRATGPYPHPNNLALFLERAGVLGAGFALGRRSFDKWVGAAAVVTLAGAGMTFSRGAGLAILLGLLFLLFALRRPRGMWLVAGLAIAMGGVLLVVAGERVLDTGSTGTGSTRWLIWESATRMALDHPVWGVGLDQFYTQYWPRYVDPAGWPERYTAHAHNLLLDVWLRLGILGLVAATGIGALVGRHGHRVLQARTSVDALALGALAALVTGFVHGMVDNGFFLPDLAVLTWFLIALIERSPEDLPTRPADPGVVS